MTCSRSNDLVRLDGPPAEVGRAFGEMNAADIRGGVEAFFSEMDRDSALRATAAYRAIVQRLAPHWVEEAEALAGAAGVGAEEYLAFQGAKYRGINRGECFTWFSAAGRRRGGATLFHKNRDNRDRPQCAYVKGLTVPRGTVHRFAATADTSDMGTMMGLNEKGLAAAADTGARDPDPRFAGMMNPDLMRLILEQASDVDEAAAMLREFNAERIYAGGGIGTNWMFADVSGRALRVNHFHESLVETRDENGLLAMLAEARGELALNTLAEAEGETTAHTMNRLSRTPPILSDGNISAMTAVIPDSRTDVFGYAWFAPFHAGRTVYVPLYLGVAATPRALADGTLYRLSKQLPPGVGAAAEPFEEELDAERAGAEAAARAALRKSGPEACRQALTSACLRLARRAEDYLRSEL